MKRTSNIPSSATNRSAFTRVAPRVNTQPTTQAKYEPNLRASSPPRYDALASSGSNNRKENMTSSEPEFRIHASPEANYSARESGSHGEDLQDHLNEHQGGTRLWGDGNMPVYSRDFSMARRINDEEAFAWQGTSSPLRHDPLQTDHTMVSLNNNHDIPQDLPNERLSEKSSWWDDDMQWSLPAFEMPGNINREEVFAWLATSPHGIDRVECMDYPLNHEDVIALANVLKMNTALKEVIFVQNEIGNKGAAILAEMLKENGSLQFFQMSSNSISDAGFTALFNALKTNTTLEVLKIYKNELTDQSGHVLSELLLANSNLKSLNISGCGIPHKTISELLLSLQKNASLRSLDLSENHFDAECTRDLVSMLKTNKTIAKIKLKECGISDEGLQILLDVVKANLIRCTLTIAEAHFGLIDTMPPQSQRLIDEQRQTMIDEINRLQNMNSRQRQASQDVAVLFPLITRTEAQSTIKNV